MPTIEEINNKVEKMEDKFTLLHAKIEETREAQIKWIAVTEQLAKAIDGLKDSIKVLRSDQKWAYRFAIGTMVGMIVNVVLLFFKT